ncbi:uncharacterized protein LOC106163367 [Lingula anatina]|uniref:Uncharacterized protein LOC106163367 n=1 Tax=Lingula anatina TaxID=7574 RepID=A0A1S3IDZ1_LINAN|nr:uncharacterized protein LOC106163367 [Lingula anatina]|eukprot:XP_013396378.2 uncharacterized protein LOC106163367 [Lingula anatina]
MKFGSITLTVVASAICVLGLYQLLSAVTWLRYMDSGYLHEQSHFTQHFTARKGDIKSKIHIQDMRSITCKNTTLKKLDPFHPSALPYIPHFPPLKCRRQASVAESKVDGDGYLTLIIKNYSKVTDNIHCYYQYIRHPTKPYKEDEAFVLSKRIDLSPANRVKLQEDFVYVFCINETGYKVYENFHLHMVKKEEELISKKYSEITGNQPRLNVLIVINDGVSMSGAVRYLPKTIEYLKKEMNGTIFPGCHAVGENSLPNLFPLLTGLPHTEASIDAPFVWKHFSEKGYKTFYLEDKVWATFTYVDPEATRPPADYYTHPFWVAMENSSLYWDSQTFCLGNDPIHRIALQYLGYYVENYQRQSYFGLYFLNELSHDYGSAIQLADADYRDFLKEHNERGHFNNTIMLFMSDHGSRFFGLRSTPIGHLEASNPLLTMVLPPWLKQQYPHIAEAVNSNAERLVTPYDIHATHDYGSAIQLADADYRDFLKEHNERGHFNNTIMLFMSDHGSRFFGLRSTPIGHLEASNPLLTMVLPPWLKQQYPHIAEAVNSNAERLVTPYDIHATLVDILHSDLPITKKSTNGKKRRERLAKGISLFQNLPSRTCASAGIPEDTCTLCTPLEPTFLDINSQKARFIANAVLTKINYVLVNATSECDVLLISDITYIAVTSYDRLSVTYIVIVKTVPGSGIFEASVLETRAMASDSTESQYTVITPVIRISLYDNNCCCAEDSRIDKYCHCKVTRRQSRSKVFPLYY